MVESVSTLNVIGSIPVLGTDCLNGTVYAVDILLKPDSVEVVCFIAMFVEIWKETCYFPYFLLKCFSVGPYSEYFKM